MKDVKEIWKDINELSSRYSISNLGRIRRNAYSGYKFKCSEKILDLKPRGDGYVDFSCKISSVVYHFLIHRLVASYFIENNYGHPVVNHIDHDKSNNAAINLEWTSYSGNTKHWIKNKGKSDSSIVKFEPMDGEIFITIDGASKYKVSNFGRVVSFFYKNPRVLKPNMSAEYPTVQVKSDEGSQRNTSVHKLVATHFLYNNHNLPVINHKDGNKKNFRASNLEWCSYAYNSQHAVSLSENRHGENHHKSTLSNDKVLAIAKAIRDGDNNKVIRRNFDISPQVLHGIKSGIRYGRITGFCVKPKTKRIPLTMDDVRMVEKLLENNTVKETCIITSLGESTVRLIKSRKHKFSKHG